MRGAGAGREKLVPTVGYGPEYRGFYWEGMGGHTEVDPDNRIRII